MEVGILGTMFSPEGSEHLLTNEFCRRETACPAGHFLSLWAGPIVSRKGNGDMEVGLFSHSSSGCEHSITEL